MSVDFKGTLSIEERLHDENVLWKNIAKRVSQTLRVGLPGKIVAFNPNTQFASIQIMITENIVINQLAQAMTIHNLEDVLVMLPGDSDFCITFPSLIGAECLVLFADMCINAWATKGGVQNQEIQRRHSLSDGFAVLSPRSRPNVIQNYSTNSMEIRALDSTVKIGLNKIDGVTVTTPKMKITNDTTVQGVLLANELATTQTPSASTTTSNFSVPIVFNGVTYYMRLSLTP